MPEWEHEALTELFDAMIKPVMDYVRSGIVDGEIAGKLTKVVPASDLEMTKQYCARSSTRYGPSRRRAAARSAATSRASSRTRSTGRSRTPAAAAAAAAGGGGQARPPQHTPGELCAAAQAS
jgi:hypothetical protein